MVGGYNLMRDDTALLERHEKSPPSFSVQLYPHEWSLNDSSKKFSYSSQTSSILDDIRAFRIPTDFIDLFDEVGVPYYDGCLIVELHNYRPLKAKDPIPTQPSRERVILRPTPETIWQDICLMNAKTGSQWVDTDALELEAKILLATSNPLCLDPDPNLTRVINSILRVSTPNVPSSLRRKAAAMDPEEDESEKIKRTKVMQFMNPKMGPTRKPVQPNYKILALRERERLGQLPPPQPRQLPIQAPAQAQAGAALTPPGANVVNNATQENGTQDAAQPPAPIQAPPIAIPAQVPVSAAISQPIPVSMPPAHIPQHLQPIADPSKRVSPVKQHSNAPTPRPPSQPVAGPSNVNTQQNAAIAMQAFAHAQAQAQAQALAQRMQAAQQHQHQQQQHQQQQAAQQQQAQSQQQQAAVGLGIGLSPSFSLQAPPSRRKSIASKPDGTPASQSQPLPQGTPQTQHSQLQPQQKQPVQIPVQSGMGMQQQQQQQVPIRPQSQNQPRPQSQPQQQQQSPVPTQQQPVQAQQQPAQPRQQQQQPAVPMQQMHPGMQMSMQNMQAYMRATAAAQASGQMIPNAAMAAAQRALQSRTGTPANNGAGSPGPSTAAMTRSPMPPSAKISGRSGTPLVNNQALPQGPAGVTPNIQQQPMQMAMQLQGQGQVQQPAMQGASQQATALFRAQQQAAYQRFMLQQMQANQMRPPTAAGQHAQMQVPMAIPQAAANVQQKQPGQEQAGPVQQQFTAGVPQQPMFMPQNINQQQQQYMMWQQLMRQQQQRGVPQAQAQAQAQAQMQMQLQNGQQMPNMAAAAMAYQQQMQSMARGNGMGNRQ